MLDMFADRPGACAEDHADLIIAFALCDLLRSRLAAVAGASAAFSAGSARSMPEGHSANQLLVFTRMAQGCEIFRRTRFYLLHKKRNVGKVAPLGFKAGKT
jgi:hypothetical protein